LPLTLTILGAGPAGPNPGGANSGYLVRQSDTTAVVVDCGAGVAGRIVQHVPANRLGGVAISHLHPDHYFDLVALYYQLKFGDARPPDLSPRVPLWVPPGGREFFDRLGRLISARRAMLEDVFDVRDYSPGVETRIGQLTFSFHPVQHYILSHGMRVRSDDGALLAFSSDVAPCPGLIDVARDADLFLCESALLDPSQDERDPKLRGHLSAGEAGMAAARANAKRLLITHYRSSERDDAHHLAAARQTFSGQVELAREGANYDVG
jgi:ribonuclease BN (tRNA processing enzyme)